MTIKRGRVKPSLRKVPDLEEKDIGLCLIDPVVPADRLTDDVRVFEGKGRRCHDDRGYVRRTETSGPEDLSHRIERNETASVSGDADAPSERVSCGRDMESAFLACEERRAVGRGTPPPASAGRTR